MIYCNTSFVNLLSFQPNQAPSCFIVKHLRSLVHKGSEGRKLTCSFFNPLGRKVCNELIAQDRTLYLFHKNVLLKFLWVVLDFEEPHQRLLAEEIRSSSFSVWQSTPSTSILCLFSDTNSHLVRQPYSEPVQGHHSHGHLH